MTANTSKMIPNNEQSEHPHLKPFEITPLQNNPLKPHVEANSSGVKKGHFLPPKITPMPVPPPTQKALSDQQQCSEDEGDEEEEAEGDGGEMMQPPQISVNILQDPTQMDAYIHQLKEVLFNKIFNFIFAILIVCLLHGDHAS